MISETTASALARAVAALFAGSEPMTPDMIESARRALAMYRAENPRSTIGDTPGNIPLSRLQCRPPPIDYTKRELAGALQGLFNAITTPEPMTAEKVAHARAALRLYRFDRFCEESTNTVTWAPFPAPPVAILTEPPPTQAEDFASLRQFILANTYGNDTTATLSALERLRRHAGRMQALIDGPPCAAETPPTARPSTGEAP